MSLSKISSVLLALSSFAAPFASAQSCSPQPFPNPLLPPGAAAGADFGKCVAVRGDYAIVGAPSAKGGAGAVYFYALENGNWVQKAEVTASGGSSTHDAFGSSVAMYGDRAFVGAPGAAGHAASDGKVFVYRRTLVLGYELWLLETKLFAADGVDGDMFGGAVAADDGVLVVGQPRVSVPNNLHIGQVLTYELAGGVWTQKSKLVPTNALQWEQFGASLAFDAPYLVIGSPTHGGPNPYPSDNGRAWIFRRNTATSWAKEVVLDPLDYTANREYGAAVAISGTRVLIGAPGAQDSASTYGGAGYVYEKPFGSPTWMFSAKLTSPQNGYPAAYGSGVALTLNQAWLGGHAQVQRFDFNSAAWALSGEVVAPFSDLDPAKSPIPVGPSLGADGATVFCGQPGAGVNDPEAAYVFHSCGGQWTVLGQGTQGGFGKPRLRGAGTLQDGLATEIRVAGGKPSAPALFLLHGGPSTPGVAYAGGFLYALPANLAVPVVLGAKGDLSLPAVLPAGLANVKFVTQVLIGDPFASHDIALTNGLEITVGI